MTLFDYLLRANLYLLLFFGCYYLLLRRHTFFRLNRFYLLTSVGLALGLPFVQLPGETMAVLPVVRPPVLDTVIIRPVQATSTDLNWITVGWCLYGLVATGLLLRLVWRTTRLLTFIQSNPRQPFPHYTLVVPVDPNTPTFSFFRYMILSPADAASEPVRQHELVHIRQWHSADVLFVEVMQALFWYNPVLLAYRVAFREVHEFLADAAASGQHRSAYATYLLSYALGSHPDTLTNSFFRPSLLPTRLRMLGRRATTRWSLSKYAVVLPLVALVLGLTAAGPKVKRLVRPMLLQKPILVKGRVLGPEDRPLRGASVIVVGTLTGTTTDMGGRFDLHTESGVRLAVSFVGFETKQIVAKAGTELNVSLAPKPTKARNKSTKVKVSYQPSAKPIAIDTAFPSPGVKHALPNEPLSPLSQTPQGTRVYLRGRATDTGNPLYILNGVKMGKEYALNTLDPEDIVSISVLKGASAGATYGDTGADGVVIITTKTTQKHANEPDEPDKH